MTPQVEAAGKIHSLKRHNLVHEVMNPKVDAWHDVYYHCTVVGRMKDHTGKVVAHVLSRNPIMYNSNPGTTCKNVHKLHYLGCNRDHDESDELCPFYDRSTAAATAFSAIAASPPVVPAASLTPVAGPFKDIDTPSAKANRQDAHAVASLLPRTEKDQTPTAGVLDDPMTPQVEAAGKIHSLKRHNLVHEVMNPKVDAWHDVYYHCTVVGRMKDHTGKVVAHVLSRNPIMYNSNPGTTCKNVHKLHYLGCNRDHDESDELCPFYDRSTAAATAFSAIAASPPVVPAASLTPVAGPFIKKANAPSERANRQEATQKKGNATDVEDCTEAAEQACFDMDLASGELRQTSPALSSVASTCSSLLDLKFVTSSQFQGQSQNITEKLALLEAAAHHRRDRHSDFDKGSVHIGKLRRKKRMPKPKPNNLGIKRGTMKERKCTSEAVLKTLSTSCSCGRNCNIKFTAEQLLNERNALRDTSIAEQNQTLTRQLRTTGFVKLPEDSTSSSSTSSSTSSEPSAQGKKDFIFRFVLADKEVCGPFWWRSLGIGKGRYVQIRKRVKGNATDNIVTYRRAKTKGPASNFAQFYLQQYFVQNGQHVPNKPEIHLPHGTQKNTIYKEFEAFHAKHPEVDRPGLQSHKEFLRLWRDTFPTVKCLKSTDFALCSNCSFFREQLHFGNLSPTLRAKLDFVYKEHLRDQSSARQLFYQHNTKAKLNPKAASWIVDGMTQGTTALPKFKDKNKKWEKMKQHQRPHLATHLMGVLTSGERPNAELSHKNISNDGNLVVDTLHRAINRLQETRIRDGRPLPSVAYIQLDNVSSNKCSLVMAYGCWLVQQGIFDKVRFCYCLVGHTHENIDQFFSRLAEKLRSVSRILTLDELKNLVESCFRSQENHTPSCQVITHVHDWKGFLGGSIYLGDDGLPDVVDQFAGFAGSPDVPDVEPCFHKIHNIKHYHQFKICKNQDGKVVLFARQHATPRKEWKPEGGIEVLHKGTREARPRVLHPLPMDDGDMLALNMVKENFTDGSDPFWPQDEKLREFWTREVEYQENLRDGTLPEIPSNQFPVLRRHDSIEPLMDPLRDDEDLKKCDPKLLAFLRIEPPPLLYTGKIISTQRQREDHFLENFANDHDWELATMTIGSIAVVKAPVSTTAHKGFTFKLKVKNKLSPLLFLVKVTKQDLHNNRLSFTPFRPLVFSGNSGSTIGKELCCDENTFEKEATGKERTIKFNCESIFGAWDLDLEDKSLFPKEQVDHVFYKIWSFSENAKNAAKRKTQLATLSSSIAAAKL